MPYDAAEDESASQDLTLADASRSKNLPTIIKARAGLVAFKFLLGVCEGTGLAEQKNRAARTIEVIRKRGSRMGRRSSKSISRHFIEQ